MAISDVASKTSVCGADVAVTTTALGSRRRHSCVGRPGFHRFSADSRWSPASDEPYQQPTQRPREQGYSDTAERCWNLSRGIMPWDVKSWTTSALRRSLRVRRFYTSTKLTRQSAQSGVPRRTQSLQLIESSISLLMRHPSLSTTLHRAVTPQRRDTARSPRPPAGPKSTPSLNTRRATDRPRRRTGPSTSRRRRLRDTSTAAGITPLRRFVLVSADDEDRNPQYVKSALMNS